MAWVPWSSHGTTGEIEGQRGQGRRCACLARALNKPPAPSRTRSGTCAAFGRQPRLKAGAANGGAGWIAASLLGDEGVASAHNRPRARSPLPVGEVGLKGRVRDQSCARSSGVCPLTLTLSPRERENGACTDTVFTAPLSLRIRIQYPRRPGLDPGPAQRLQEARAQGRGGERRCRLDCRVLAR